MAQAVEDRRDREPLEEGVGALIDQMSGAAPAMERDPEAAASGAAIAASGAAIVDPPRTHAETNGLGAEDSTTAEVNVSDAIATVAAEAGMTATGAPEAIASLAAPEAVRNEQAAPEASNETVAPLPTPTEPAVALERPAESTGDGQSPATAVEEAMRTASATLSEAADKPAEPEASVTPAEQPAIAVEPSHAAQPEAATESTILAGTTDATEPAAAPAPGASDAAPVAAIEASAEATEPARDLAGAVSQLIDSTRDPGQPSQAAATSATAPERIDSLDAALAGKGDELIAGEFADENSVLTGAPDAAVTEPSTPPIAPPAASDEAVSSADRRVTAAPTVAAVAASGLASSAPQAGRESRGDGTQDTAAPPTITPPRDKPSMGAEVARLARPITLRLKALGKGGLYSMSAPLQGRPKAVRDAVAWMALVQAFFAVCVWAYVVIRPKEARPPEGPVAVKADGGAHGGGKADAHGKGSDGHGAAKKDDHGAAKKDSHGSAKKPPAKKDSHASAKKEPAGKAKKPKESSGGH